MEFSFHNVLVAFTIEGEVTMEKLQESMYQLIVETSTNLPKDVRRAIQQAKERENAGTRSAMALGTITNNIKMADDNISPICQDTGMPTFKIYTPVGVNQLKVKELSIVRLSGRQKMVNFVQTLLILFLETIAETI